MTPYYQDDAVTLYQDRPDESPEARQLRLARERTRRYRARLAGEDVAWQPRPRGYTQAPEHVEKRKRFGADHPRWAGDDTSKKVGRKRALRMYPEIGPCGRCGAQSAERHHVDENTSNNSFENIEALCRACHIEEHRRRREAGL